MVKKLVQESPPYSKCPKYFQLTTPSTKVTGILAHASTLDSWDKDTSVPDSNPLGTLTGCAKEICTLVYDEVYVWGMLNNYRLCFGE